MPQTFFIGTYSEPGGSRGIYRATFDPDLGGLTEPELVGESNSPSFLARHPRELMLYAIHEEERGMASAWRITESHSLEQVNQVAFEGSYPCHIAIDPTGRWALVSAYGGGALVVIEILPDGKLGRVTDRFVNEGSGPNVERQEKPHIHFAESDPSGQFLTTCDLGTDEIISFRLDPNSGRLSRVGSVRTSGGSGPRHTCRHRDGQHLFATLELSVGIATLTQDPASGDLSLIRELSLSSLYPSLEGSKLSGIKMHPSQPRVYAASVPASAIVALRVMPGGELAPIGLFKLDVTEPRDLTFDATGRWLLVAAKGNGLVGVFPVHAVDGTLGDNVAKIEVPRAACLV